MKTSDDIRDKVQKPWKLWAIIIVAVSGMTAATIILMQGSANAAQNSATILVFVTATIATLVGLQVKDIHGLVNSTAAELREVKAQLAYAKGLAFAKSEESSTLVEVDKAITKAEIVKTTPNK